MISLFCFVKCSATICAGNLTLEDFPNLVFIGFRLAIKHEGWVISLILWMQLIYYYSYGLFSNFAMLSIRGSIHS